MIIIFEYCSNSDSRFLSLIRLLTRFVGTLSIAVFRRKKEMNYVLGIDAGGTKTPLLPMTKKGRALL